MGIKYFFSWFRKNFPNRIKSYSYKETIDDEICIDNLLIDLNGIIHTCAQMVYKYGENYKPLLRKKVLGMSEQLKTFDLVWNEIKKIIEFSRVKKRVMICIDGVAPVSKQIQQRQRRFRAVKDKNKDEFDSNCITPGTKFMDYLSKFLDKKIREDIQGNDKWADLEILFSNEKVPGEGEHKLVNYVRKYGRDDESYCIHGMDADLVMLALSTHKNNFHILRDNHRNRMEVYHINLENIRKDLISILRWENNNYKCLDENLINDFIFMMFSVGNDFLPHIPCIEILDDGIEILLETYRKNCENFGHLTYKTKEHGVFFDQESFSEFFRLLGMYEEGILNKKINSKQSYHSDEIMDKNTKVVDGNYVIDLENYKKDYYKKKITNLDISKEYVKGLQWVLTYYTHGVHNWNWYYPAYYTIFSSDLVSYVKNHKHSIPTTSSPLKPFEQLMCVLPPFSRSLLPSPLCDLLTNKSLPIHKYYPDNFEIDMAGKRNEWEGIALLPILNIEEIRTVYKRFVDNVSLIDKKRNVYGFTFSYKKTEINSLNI